MYLENHTVVVLCYFFWFWREIVFGVTHGFCCCVSFWFWREISSFFVVAGKFYYDQKKKVLVVCLAGCAVVSVFSSGNYNQKKKVLVVHLAGCAVVSVFGSGRK